MNAASGSFADLGKLLEGRRSFGGRDRSWASLAQWVSVIGDLFWAVFGQTESTKGPSWGNVLNTAEGSARKLSEMGRWRGRACTMGQ